MEYISIFLIGVSLSMDAFSVAVCKGLAMKKINWKSAFIIALFFGFFQALMPSCGFALGIRFRKYVESFAPIIAFVLLFILGGKMIYEAIKDKGEDADTSDKIDIKELFVLAVATSIDALIVGITFAADGMALSALPISVSIIGITTFLISLIGVAIGNRFGVKYNKGATIFGGIVLILIGVKSLIF